VKLIGSTAGRCLKLFAWEEVRPPHGISTSLLVAALAEQFNFLVKPSLPVPPDSMAKFADGAIVIDGARIAIQKFDIYSDGYSVECTHTDDAKLVSDEVFKWAKTEIGFRDFVREPRVVFISDVTVEFAPEFENIFRGWKRLQPLLNGSVQGRYGFDKSINVHRVQWRGDAFTVVNNLLVSDFWIERRVGEPYTENRWHCHGPLPTDEWLSLLESIEQIATNG
jgi:hypothetical protein